MGDKQLRMIADPQIAPACMAANSAERKETELRGLMRELGNVLVAYSGGVDSAYLAKIATEELGQNAICVLGLSPSVSAYQRETAAELARVHGFKYKTIETEEVEDGRYAANPTNRCYFCKSELYSRLDQLAVEFRSKAVLDGTNADDLGDHRPGRLAAEENSVRSPLAEVGFTKAEIRERSNALGLDSWDKPASPCLSSRIAYGTPVTISRLNKVERGEDILRSLGYREFRVRVHGDLARIEISPQEIGQILHRDSFREVASRFRSLGFSFVTLDMDGFRSGSMNGASVRNEENNQ